MPFLLGGPSMEGSLATAANTGFYHTVSHDGGTTWSAPQRIDPRVNYAGQSNMAVTPEGEDIYVVGYEEPDRKPLEYTYEDGRFYLLASEDGGATWEAREMFHLEGTIGSALTSLTVASDGTLAFAWSEATEGRSQTHLAVSTDGGSSWSETVLPLSGGTQAMPFVRFLAPGVLGVLWYDAHVEGLTGEVDADWHVHYARVTGVSTGALDVTTTRLSDTVHEGNICVLGPACSESGGDRRLLDYVWLDEGPEGAVHAAWASTLWDRPSAFPVHAVSRTR